MLKNENALRTLLGLAAARWVQNRNTVLKFIENQGTAFQLSWFLHCQQRFRFLCSYSIHTCYSSRVYYGSSFRSTYYWLGSCSGWMPKPSILNLKYNFIDDRIDHFAFCFELRYKVWFCKYLYFSAGMFVNLEVRRRVEEGPPTSYNHHYNLTRGPRTCTKARNLRLWL